MLPTIRPYNDADFEDVVTVWFESWKSVGVGSVEPSVKAELRERFPIEIAEGWSVHVATLANNVVGFTSIKGDEVGQLFVAPEMQGRGIGKQLLDFVKLQRPSGFWLTTPAEGRAVRFYEREGLRRGELSKHPRLGHAEVRYDWQPPD
jgi:GNAT superfamily N-acetyltransferase